MEARIARAHPPAFHFHSCSHIGRSFRLLSNANFVAANFLHAAASFAPSGSGEALFKQGPLRVSE